MGEAINFKQQNKTLVGTINHNNNAILNHIGLGIETNKRKK